MTKLGQRLIHALTEAVEGDFARVTIDGITWVRKDEARNQALEEAAKYIESRAYGDGTVDEPADDLAAAIRALKGKP